MDVDEGNGVVSFHFYQDENLNPGTYDLEIRVSYDGVHSEVFPSDSFIPIKIVEDISYREDGKANQKALALIIEKAKDSTNEAKEQSEYAKSQGDHAKTQGDYAKSQGDYAKEQASLINSKADKTELEKVSVRVSTVSGRMEIAEGNIGSLTSEVDSTKSKIIDLNTKTDEIITSVEEVHSGLESFEIGGRNLLKKEVTRTENSATHNSVKHLDLPINNSRIVYEFYDNNQLELNQDYILKVENFSEEVRLGIFYNKGANAIVEFGTHNEIKFNTGAKNDIQIVIKSYADSQWAENIKLSKKDKSDGWSIPPEDIVETFDLIEALKNNVITLEERIKSLEDEKSGV